MPLTKEQQAVKQCVENLIESGSHYNVDALELIYHPALRIVKIDDKGRVTAINREQNMRFFRDRRDSCAPPLSKDVEFNYIEADSGKAHVIVTRRMQMTDRPEKSVFSIQLIRESGVWRVINEVAFVQPLEQVSQ